MGLKRQMTAHATDLLIMQSAWLATVAQKKNVLRSMDVQGFKSIDYIMKNNSISGMHNPTQADRLAWTNFLYISAYHWHNVLRTLV